ncbi:NAD(P)(+) transhydrogenase (Re/Si-specific) subunit beta [Bradyrhizobium elkanii]|uniref:NAD(P)(+) transhydrogenase (Re/Si-specific) subunit beta n=1 Tax=Bradyrhizobium elkanii TaxID=29448 RepID=A0A4U6S087_BRAEL|nr:NAD(P)(+) transhydrogenase (Re/Si-specific) subunit beta [Bradyrhizobium elkanii]TKV80093.1 NAD(P)(+) transhydrogenase (Re/Si-specific) subunit beta [Bradyrhizobium elkanii]
MYVEKYPQPTQAEMKRAKEAGLRRDAERRWQYSVRLQTQPNVVYFREVAYAILLVVVISAVTMYGSYWLFEKLAPLISRQPPWLSVFELACVAVFVGFAAWYLREKRKLKLYPIVEIALGATLSVQGLILDPDKVSLLAGLVAFVGGVRIIIDGFKRLVEYQSFHLARLGFYEYYWRKFKRFSRARLAPDI